MHHNTTTLRGHIRVRSAIITDKRPIYHLIDSIPQFTAEEKKIAHDLVRLALKDSHKYGYHILVATLDRIVVGYLCYGNTPLTKTTHDLYWLAVNPELQGRGIARTLLDRLTHTLQKKHILVLRAETSGTAHYHSTRLFYEKLGFEKCGLIKNFYGKKDDLITYVLNIK